MTNIKLILSEVDGVLTNGLVPIDELGNTSFKLFNLGDFEVINKLKSNYSVVFIASDNAVSYNLFRRKNTPFYWAKKDKYNVMLSILRKYNVTAEEVVYVCSKFSDIKCAQTIPKSFCTSNSNNALKSICTVLSSASGEGVLTELYLDYLK